MKILVVDDVPDNVDLLCEMLEGEYEVLSAFNGADAVKLALTEKPHIIILDVKMPKMDGYQVLSQLKADDITREIPVIFLTASYKDSDRVAEGLNLGAVDYITKPVDGEILLARISLAARIKRAEDAVKASRSELEMHVEKRTKQLSEANAELRQEIGIRKQVEEKLLWKEKKVEEQAARLKTYVYTAAHFLKVPLTKIQGFSKVLSSEVDKLRLNGGVDDKPVQKIKEFAHIIKAEVSEAISLDLYFLEYANVAVLEPAYEKVALSEVLDKSVEEIKTKYSERNPVVTVQGEVAELLHNRVHLEKVFFLLFTNLISRTPKPVNPNIIVNVKGVDNFVDCCVESLTPVKEDNIDTLFDFLPEISVSGRGLGSELSLVKSYVELYGGEISLVMGTDSGRFNIRLKNKETRGART